MNMSSPPYAADNLPPLLISALLTELITRASKNEGQGENSVIPAAPRQHLCTSPDNQLREQRADQLRRQIISNIRRRGHIPSPNENHLAPKKEAMGEDSLLPRAPYQHVSTSPANELRE
jgi:hypothetical protein